MDFFLVGTLHGLGVQVEIKGSTQTQIVDFYARSALPSLNRIMHGTRWSEPFQIHLHEPPGRVPPCEMSIFCCISSKLPVCDLGSKQN